MLDKALEVLVDQIDEKVARLQETLAAGAAKDYAEYQKMCGEIQGLLTARLNTTDLRQTMETNDE